MEQGRWIGLERVVGENQVRRGDVYWLKVAPPDKRRPVVILTRDAVIPHLNAVVVASITSTFHRTPAQVVIGVEDGMLALCAVNLHHIHYASKNRLEKFITRLDAGRMEEIRDAITYALQLEAPE